MGTDEQKLGSIAGVEWTGSEIVFGNRMDISSQGFFSNKTYTMSIDKNKVVTTTRDYQAISCKVKQLISETKKSFPHRKIGAIVLDQFTFIKLMLVYRDMRSTFDYADEDWSTLSLGIFGVPIYIDFSVTSETIKLLHEPELG